MSLCIPESVFPAEHVGSWLAGQTSCVGKGREGGEYEQQPQDGVFA